MGQLKSVFMQVSPRLLLYCTLYDVMYNIVIIINNVFTLELELLSYNITCCLPFISCFYVYKHRQELGITSTLHLYVLSNVWTPTCLVLKNKH